MFHDHFITLLFHYFNMTDEAGVLIIWTSVLSLVKFWARVYIPTPMSKLDSVFIFQSEFSQRAKLD